MGLAKRFYNYCNRVFQLSQRLETHLEDVRVRPTHSLESIVLKVLAGIGSGRRSMNQLEEAIRRGHLDGIGSSRRPSADTVTYAFGRMGLSGLETVQDGIVNKARYNHALDNTLVEGYRVVAVDGSGLFSTRSERLGKHGHHRRDTHGEKTSEDLWLEHALAVSYVSEDGPNLLLDLVRIPAGKGETTVARRVLKDLGKRLCRFCDIITADALYAGAPFLNEVLSQNKDFVVRVKQGRYSIIEDAGSLFDQMAPHHTYKDISLRKEGKRIRFDLEIWDEKDFTSWEDVNRPLRCLRVRETRKELNASGQVLKVETIQTHFVTSCSQEAVPALTVWKIAHRRWDIENTGFHFLKNHFQLNHAYTYDPKGITIMLKLFVIAFNLFQLFVKRNLRSKRWTLLGVMDAIWCSLPELKARRPTASRASP